MSDATNDPPALSGESTPEEILEGLGIKSRAPIALTHAREWATILEQVANGADAKTARQRARVPHRTLYAWLAKGRGDAEKGIAPLAPYDEFVAAFDEARATATGDAWSALKSASDGGDVRAAEIIIRRRAAQEEAVRRSSLARAQINGQIITNRIKRMEEQKLSLEIKVLEEKLKGTYVDRVEIKHLSEMSDEQLREEANRLLAELSAKPASSSAELADEE